MVTTPQALAVEGSNFPVCAGQFQPLENVVENLVLASAESYSVNGLKNVRIWLETSENRQNLSSPVETALKELQSERRVIKLICLYKTLR